MFVPLHSSPFSPMFAVTVSIKKKILPGAQAQKGQSNGQGRGCIRVVPGKGDRKFFANVVLFGSISTTLQMLNISL